MSYIEEFKIGQFVVSKAGRDKEKIFIVIDRIDENYLLLVDGDLRKIESPKKKKIRHINILDQVSVEIENKLRESKKVTNLMIRKEIEKLGVANI